MGGLIAGVTINVQFKRIYPNIVSLPFYARLPLRMILLGIPFVAMNHLLIGDMDRLTTLQHKYFIRIVKFRRTGNIEYMFPQEDAEQKIPTKK